MIDGEGFKRWLQAEKQYSRRVCNDTASRLRRVDKLLPWQDSPYYLFEIQNNEGFKSLSMSVRSQCKKAVLLYIEFQRRHST